MEKKKYIKPLLNNEEFVPQEYIASCESGEQYIFKCDAGQGRICNAYYEDNGIDGLQRDGYKPDHKLGLMTACNKTHVVSKTDEFRPGYLTYGTGSATVEKVIIWAGSQGDNIHATKQLYKELWQTTKS